MSTIYLLHLGVDLDHKSPFTICELCGNRSTDELNQLLRNGHGKSLHVIVLLAQICEDKLFVWTFVLETNCELGILFVVAKVLLLQSNYRDVEFTNAVMHEVHHEVVKSLSIAIYFEALEFSSDVEAFLSGHKYFLQHSRQIKVLLVDTN